MCRSSQYHAAAGIPLVSTYGDQNVMCRQPPRARTIPGAAGSARRRPVFGGSHLGTRVGAREPGGVDRSGAGAGGTVRTPRAQENLTRCARNWV